MIFRRLLQLLTAFGLYNEQIVEVPGSSKDRFLDVLVSNMTVQELGKLFFFTSQTIIQDIFIQSLIKAIEVCKLTTKISVILDMETISKPI